MFSPELFHLVHERTYLVVGQYQKRIGIEVRIAVFAAEVGHHRDFFIIRKIR